MTSGAQQSDRVVVSRLCSGLGNQLFQYACGLAIARRSGAGLKLDTTWFQLVARIHHPVRHLRLPALGITAPEVFAGPRRLAVGAAAAVFDRTGRGRTILEGLAGMRVVQEGKPLHGHDWAAIAATDRAYLNGYWQTADHCVAVGQEIRALCGFGERPLSAAATRMRAGIHAKPTAFLHVRRGDYQQLVGESGLLPAGYYRRAASTITDALGEQPRWLVFAEDAAWARENLGFLGDWVLADYVSPDRDIEDLVLMAACDAGIIANSSYSWWGAALGDRPGRPVVAPATYWNRPGTGLEEWALPRWQRIPGWD